MSENDDLSRKLCKQNGIGHDSRREVEEIERLIRRETRRTRQSTWITVGLWVASFGFLALRLPSLSEALMGPGDLTAFWLCLVAFGQFVPTVAIVATIVLLVRLRQTSKQQLSLRLARIEEQLRRLQPSEIERGDS